MEFIQFKFQPHQIHCFKSQDHLIHFHVTLILHVYVTYVQANVKHIVCYFSVYTTLSLYPTWT